jgi:predicted ATPase
MTEDLTGLPNLSGLDAVPPHHNLPAQLTPFVGRAALLAEIEQRLSDPSCRLLTLVGPGGSGKTRLALEAAARRLDDYEHGVFLVSLAPLDATREIVPAIAQALGFAFHGEGEPKEQLLRYLQEKNLLLLLDNAEHLPDVGAIATDILQAASQATVLVTSRAGLHVQGEHRLPVEGMEVPEQKSDLGEKSDVWQTSDFLDRYSAIRLFLDGARRRQSNFALNAENAVDMVRICQLVEGMPLGILLAAAWVALVAPGEIADEIERGLDFLESDRQNVPARQRSLRATFNYSWSLLAEREREVFAALSVFRGGFTREAAQKVTGVSLRSLMALADKSLIHRLPGGRFEVHELMRQYAVEKLATATEAEQQVRDRHTAHYAAALQAWGKALQGTGQLDALTEIEADLDNARVAWEWAVAQGQVQALDWAMDGLCRFYEWRGRYEEGDEACRAAIEALDTPTSAASSSSAAARSRVEAKAIAWRGTFSRALRRLEQAKTLLKESLARLEILALASRDVRQEKAFALWQMGYTLCDLGDVEARRRYEQCLTLYRALGDRWGTATALYHLGDLLTSLGAVDEAEPLVRESLAIQQDLGDQKGATSSRRVLGYIAQWIGQLEESERLTRESVSAFHAMGDRAHAAEALINWGYALTFLGKLAEAHTRFEESVAIYRDLGFSGSASSLALVALSETEMYLGHYDQASERVQEALTLAQRNGYYVGVSRALLVLGSLAYIKADYDRAKRIFEQERFATDEVVSHYIALTGLGSTEHKLGQDSRAGQYLCQALRLVTETQAMTILLPHALSAVALLLIDRREVERAVELYALVSRYPFVANSRSFEEIYGQHITAAAAALPPEVIAAAQERGQARDLMATAKELLAELEEEIEEESTTEGDR